MGNPASKGGLPVEPEGFWTTTLHGELIHVVKSTDARAWALALLEEAQRRAFANGGFAPSLPIKKLIEEVRDA